MPVPGAIELMAQCADLAVNDAVGVEIQTPQVLHRPLHGRVELVEDSIVSGSLPESVHQVHVVAGARQVEERIDGILPFVVWPK